MANNLNLDTLRTLVVAYDLGGFGQAAERLGRTPSAVSLQMKKLQEDVGGTLFRKDGRRLALTEAGEIVLRYARRMLEMNDELLDTVRGAELAGTVRLGFSQDFAETILPQVLTRFTALYPLVQIELRIDGNAALVEAVETGQLDVVLAIGHEQKPTSLRVGELQLVWIAGREFSRREDQVLSLVMLGPLCMFRQRALAALSAAEIPWRIAAVSPSLAGLWATGIAGLGITARAGMGLPDGLKADAEMFGLPELGVAAVTMHRRGNEGSAVVERLAEIVEEVAGGVLSGRAKAA
jgi:DNA-binding transcriptional LysR family regulator